MEFGATRPNSIESPLASNWSTISCSDTTRDKRRLSCWLCRRTSHPMFPTGCAWLRLLLEVGEAARATDVYNKLLKDDPGNAQAWLGLGEASLRLGEYQQAEHALATAVERDPASTEAHQQLDSGARGASSCAVTARPLPRRAYPPRSRGLQHCDEPLNQLRDAERIQSRSRGYAATSSTSSQNNSLSTGRGKRSARVGGKAPAPDELQLLYSRGLQIKAAASERALRAESRFSGTGYAVCLSGRADPLHRYALT